MDFEQWLWGRWCCWWWPCLWNWAFCWLTREHLCPGGWAARGRGWPPEQAAVSLRWTNNRNPLPDSTLPHYLVHPQAVGTPGQNLGEGFFGVDFKHTCRSTSAWRPWRAQAGCRSRPRSSPPQRLLPLQRQSVCWTISIWSCCGVILIHFQHHFHHYHSLNTVFTM